MERVAWRQVCLPKDEDGLGLHDIRSWNKALLVKTLWSIHTKNDTLWVKWVNDMSSLSKAIQYGSGCRTRILLLSLRI